MNRLLDLGKTKAARTKKKSLSYHAGIGGEKPKRSGRGKDGGPAANYATRGEKKVAAQARRKPSTAQKGRKKKGFKIGWRTTSR